MNIAAGWIFSASMVIHIVQAADLCPDGFYGTNCLLACGQNCNNTRCEMDADRGIFKCSKGCVEGWTGLSCDRKCPKGCKSCDQVTGTCEACKSSCCGEHCGPICIESEPPCRKCKDSTCQHCLEGWYGHNSTIPCPQNCQSGCGKKSGHCDYQCVLGYHGNYCNKPCTTTCMAGCHQTNGSCTGGCDVGWHGQFCNMSCSNTCVDDKCSQVSGDCVIGVRDKFQTLQPANCHPVHTEDPVAKNCGNGCDAGWRGARCDQRCPEDCYSCSRYPDGRMCIYRKEVVRVHTYGNDREETGRLEIRTIYALLLVIPPFLIVGIVQLISISWEKYKLRRDMKKAATAYELCPQKINAETV